MPAEAASADVARKRDIVVNGPVTIDLVAEGQGPLIVMLPSRGRDSEDFDDLAAELARNGYRVLRPQPRGRPRRRRVRAHGIPRPQGRVPARRGRLQQQRVLQYTQERRLVICPQ